MVTLDITEFRAMYPAFADVTKYPDSVITLAFNKSTIFIKNETNECLGDSELETILYLVTAHLLAVETKAKANSSGGLIASSAVDKISVSLVAPSNTDEFNYFFNQSAYGQELLALLSLLAVGGFYIGGSPETLAFKRAF